jgi:ATP-dependent DNA helicase DinG
VISFSGKMGFRVGLIKDVRTFFSPEGSLARFKNFEYRPQQQRMAEAVAEALQNNNKLIVEAGTGVGKSLAYLCACYFSRRSAQEKSHCLYPYD